MHVKDSPIGSYNRSATVDCSDQIVGSGRYATDDGDYWISGVRATSAQGSRSSARDQSSWFQTQSAKGSSDGSASDGVYSNFDVTLAVVTTFAVNSTLNPSTQARGTTGAISDVSLEGWDYDRPKSSVQQDLNRVGDTRLELVTPSLSS